MDKLLSNAYNGRETIGEVWDSAVMRFGDASCMGTRQLLKGEEVRNDDKIILQLVFGSYHFDTFTEVDGRVSSIIAWFKSAGLKKGDHIVMFAETRAEWMQTALACFKYGLPG